MKTSDHSSQLWGVVVVVGGCCCLLKSKTGTEAVIRTAGFSPLNPTIREWRLLCQYLNSFHKGLLIGEATGGIPSG